MGEVEAETDAGKEPGSENYDYRAVQRTCFACLHPWALIVFKNSRREARACCIVRKPCEDVNAVISKIDNLSKLEESGTEVNQHLDDAVLKVAKIKLRTKKDVLKKDIWKKLKDSEKKTNRGLIILQLNARQKIRVEMLVLCYFQHEVRTVDGFVDCPV